MWLSVENASPRRLWFLRNTIDPDFYSADEAALLVRSEVPSSQFEIMRQYFRDESIRVLMQPGYVTEGFVFLPRTEGGRYVDLRLAADAYEAESMRAGTQESKVSPALGSFSELRFGFALTLPDGEFDYERLDTSRTYDGEELPNLDAESLRSALEQLPCCVTDAQGSRYGDPLNVVIVGNAEDVMHSLSRSDWSFTHRISAETVRRLIAAAIEGEGYAVAPVSNLYVFGRKQDIALQRARRSIARIARRVV